MYRTTQSLCTALSPYVPHTVHMYHKENNIVENKWTHPLNVHLTAFVHDQFFRKEIVFHRGVGLNDVPTFSFHRQTNDDAWDTSARGHEFGRSSHDFKHKRTVLECTTASETSGENSGETSGEDWRRLEKIGEG